MAKHVEISSGKDTQHKRGEQRREDDRSDAAGRRIARAAVRAAHERDEERQRLQDDTDATLDEIDEVLEEALADYSEAADGGQRRLRRSGDGAVEDRTAETLEAGLGQAALREFSDNQQAA